MKTRQILTTILATATFISTTQASPISQDCKGLVTLLSPIEIERDGWLNAQFLMHKDTFVCTGDNKSPKITGYQFEPLEYGRMNIGTLKIGQLLRVTYRLSEGVTLGGGGFLNWSLNKVENSPTPVERKTIDKLLTGLKSYTYKGNYFSIHYPKNFIVITGGNTENDRDDFSANDEAYFKSSDGLVEFFVYSPLWGGKPKNYLEILKNEVLVDEKSKKGFDTDPYRDKDRDQLLTRQVTVKAKDGAYFRSFVHTQKRSSNFSLNLSKLDLVFGIKYKNKQAYKKYRAAYIAFKKSLTQFADN